MKCFYTPKVAERGQMSANQIDTTGDLTRHNLVFFTQAALYIDYFDGRC